jgi:phosphate-selective porin
VSRDDLREEGQGIVLHYVHSPISICDAKSIHLGASLSYRWNASEDGTWFRTRPEVATVDDYFVDTGPIADADQIGRLSLEASRVAGRFSWQSKLLAARVRRDGAALNKPRLGHRFSTVGRGHSNLRSGRASST